MRIHLESLSNYFNFCVRFRLVWKIETDVCGIYVILQINLAKKKTALWESLSLIQQLFVSQVHGSSPFSLETHSMGKRQESEQLHFGIADSERAYTCQEGLLIVNWAPNHNQTLAAIANSC